MAERDCHRLALIATEAATNVLRYGDGGEMIVSGERDAAGPRITLWAIDRGHGMANVQESLRDVVSTGRSAGTGLGALRRLSDRFDIWSRPTQGTVLVVSVGAPVADDGLDVAALAVGRRGDAVCGGAWSVRRHGGAVLLMLCDGLGHGAGAAHAATLAREAFARADPEARPRAVLRSMHEALRGTRGAAVAVVRFDEAAGTVDFAGVGNIAGWLSIAGQARRTVSFDGVVGGHISTIREFAYPWDGNLLGVFHSDGLSARWTLDAYPGLATRDPRLIAGVLLRDFRRPRDDALVAVVRQAIR